MNKYSFFYINTITRKRKKSLKKSLILLVLILVYMLLLVTQEWPQGLLGKIKLLILNSLIAVRNFY